MSGGVVGPIRGEAGPMHEGDAVRLTPFDLPFEKAPGCENPDYPALAVEASEPVEMGRWT